MSERPDTGEAPGDDFLARLPAEVERWRGDKVIGARHARGILAYYGMSYSALETGRRLGRAVSVFSILGAILIGIGIILLVGANREDIGDMPRGLQVGLLAGAVIGTLALGYYLRFETRFERVGEAVLLLSTILYGAAVFLVGQIYNVRANDPLLLAYWLAGVAPLAYLARSAPVFVLTAFLAASWLGLRLAFAMKDTHMEGDVALRTIPLYLPFGVALYFMARGHDRLAFTRPYAKVLPPLGVLFVLAALYLLGFRAFYERNGDPLPDLPASVLTTYVLLTALAVAAFVASFLIDPAVWRRRLYEVLALPFLAATFLPLYLPVDRPNVYALLFNLLLLGSVLGAIGLGLARREGWFVNIGIGAFAVLAFTRYVDLTWGFFGGALFFIAAGVLAFAGSYLLEMWRRRVLRRLRGT